jgi:signal transduction histidine kinase
LEKVRLEESVAALERENRIIKRKLKRSEINRALVEEALESHLAVIRMCAGLGNDQRELIDALRAEIEREFQAKARAEEKLRRQDHLNLVGKMAASIGHGVRNPLTTVRGYLQFFESKGGFGKYKDALWLMIEELDQANAIITDYLSLAKNKRVNLLPGHLEKVVQKIKPLLQVEAIRRGQSLAFDLQATPAMQMDSEEIRQLVVNLARNGLEAMGDGGRLTVRTASAGGGVVLKVEDCGTGIAPEAMEMLGTPFFSTKADGDGLGLAVSFRIVDRHRGVMSFDSTPAGTTVTVTFPVIEQAV